MHSSPELPVGKPTTLDEPFGRYILTERLAVGGMAEIFLAELPGPGGFSKRVVVKRMLPELAEQSRYREMFLDEAKVAAKCNHSGLIPLFELVQVGPHLALVMEHVEGADFACLLALSRRLRRRRVLPTSHVLHLTARAADTLHYVHGLDDDDGTPLRIVHRDVSPSNLLLTRGGDLKVLDFGVSDHEARPAETRADVFGKLDYMAPEQRAGESVDRRADIYGLGCTLFELLTLKVYHRVGSEALSVLEDHAVLESVISLLRDMLEPDPSARLAQASEVFRRLDLVLAEVGRPSTDEIAEESARLIGELDPGQQAAGRTSIHTRATLVLQDTHSPVVEPSRDSEPPQTRSRSKSAWVALIVALMGATVFLALQATTSDRIGFEANHEVAQAKPVDPVTPKPRPPTQRPRPEPKTRPKGKSRASPPQKRATRPKSPSRAAPAKAAKKADAIDGRVVVRSEPETQVTLAGKSLGYTPLELDIGAGRHVFRFSEPHLGIKARRSVDVQPGRTARLQVRFQKGSIALAVLPWAHVFVNGKMVGTTPLAPIELYEGEHALRIANPELGTSRSVKVRVVGGKTTRISEDLRTEL
ncbi:MAG: serine/threonine-protein kinase [Myxococcota bacterium]